jgi:hypothetical protein
MIVLTSNGWSGLGEGAASKGELKEVRRICIDSRPRRAPDLQERQTEPCRVPSLALAAPRPGAQSRRRRPLHAFTAQ